MRTNRAFPILTAVFLGLMLNILAQAKTPPRHSIVTSTDTATIINSGSAGLPGYRISVAASGRISSVTVLRNGRTSGGRSGQLTSNVTRRFFSDLAQAGPVSALPVMSEPAISPDLAPGVRVYIRWQGKLSPNLRRAGSSGGATLYQDVKQISQALRLPIPDTP